MPKFSLCFRPPRLRQVLFFALATFLVSNFFFGFFLLEKSTFWDLISTFERHFPITFIPVKQTQEHSIISSIFHSAEVFKLNYGEMERRLKIFVYPDGDPNTYYHTPESLSGKYTSEGYFFENIKESGFLTNDPQLAHLFFIPISCYKMRRKGLSYENMTRTVQEYVESLIVNYPFWNRSLGADHFFVTCHDIGLKATVGVPDLVKNSIRIVCTPRYDDGYIPHKDFPLPQIIQPFALPAARYEPQNRTILGFWAGNSSSKFRRQLVSAWQNDTELDIQSNRLYGSATGKISYLDKINRAKFCICPGWSQVHGSRIALSVHHGCVPVIMSDHHDLSFNDILDWRKFSVIVKEGDIQRLKPILKRISYGKFRFLHYNAVQVQRHLQWNSPPIKYDAFHMVMYQLWLRRHVSKY
ncbi:hypothetical protein DITRI_Ditri08aG0093200 [Diplodiscus trichospermus]